MAYPSKPSILEEGQRKISEYFAKPERAARARVIVEDQEELIKQEEEEEEEKKKKKKEHITGYVERVGHDETQSEGSHNAVRPDTPIHQAIDDVNHQPPVAGPCAACQPLGEQSPSIGAATSSCPTSGSSSSSPKSKGKRTARNHGVNDTPRKKPKRENVVANASFTVKKQMEYFFEHRSLLGDRYSKTTVKARASFYARCEADAWFSIPGGSEHSPSSQPVNGSETETETEDESDDNDAFETEDDSDMDDIYDA